MSTRTEHLRRRRGPDDGFTLVEVIVALSVFGAVAVAALPLLIVGLKASQTARVETLAKDLTQLRLERLRNLPYQVDRQNGPFVDLLDRYYTNASGTSSATGEAGCTGQYLSAAPGTGGAPSGPAYRVACTSLPEAAGFSQVVYVQFLVRTRVPVTPPIGYDSQVVDRDTAPSSLVGVTVLTTWNRTGQKGTLRTYTEVADARTNQPLITTQAQAVALRVSSSDPVTGLNLTAQAGEVKADGSLTTGSVASVQTIGASVEQLGLAPVASSVRSASAPANPAGTPGEGSENPITGGSPADTTVYGNWAGCGWGWFGKSAYGNVTATTAAGRPVVPDGNADDVTASTGTSTSQSGLLNSGGGCQSYAFGFRNWLTAPAYAADTGLLTSKPLVYVLDPNGGGSLSNGRALGEASVTGTDILTLPHSASARAAARVSTVSILPIAGYENGLVTAKLTSSQVICKSGSPVSGSYELTVTWPGNSKTIKYPSVDPVPSLPAASSISFPVNGVTKTLAQYLDWDVSLGVTESTSGAQSLDHVFSVTSPDSVVGPGGLSVQLGTLSCTAADNR